MPPILLIRILPVAVKLPFPPKAQLLSPAFNTRLLAMVPTYQVQLPPPVIPIST